MYSSIFKYILLCFLLAGVSTSFAVTYSVTNNGDAGPGSLRQAILNANSTSEADIITFSIGVAGSAHSILLVTALPAIIQTLTINGWSQGGPSYTGAPLIEINGINVPTVRGIHIRAANCAVYGLVVNNFNSGIGICVNAVNSAWIYGNFIGTNATGTAAASNRDGVLMSTSSNSILGTNGDGINDAAEVNLISGNTDYAVQVFDGSFNHVNGNLIGTDPAGTTAIPNGVDGLLIINSSGNMVSGNLISGNGRLGIYLTGAATTGNWVRSNVVGLDITGSADMGNTSTGIYLGGSASANIIGSNGDGINDAAERNIVSCNDRHANTITGSNANIALSGSGTTSNVIAGNYIGLTATGTAMPGGITGGARGIQIANSSNNLIGGVTSETRNVISGHLHYGIEILGNSSTLVTGNRIIGNYIGTDANGTVAVANRNGGVQLYTYCSSNSIGTNSDGVNDDKEGNLISGNATGINLAIVSGNTIAGNYIGTDYTGLLPLPNTGNGILINASASNIIGGSSIAARNIISGNGSNGIFITGAASTANKVQGNFIGTDKTGQALIGNTGPGVYIANAANTNILGVDADGINDINEGNVISGNHWNGGANSSFPGNVRIEHVNSNNNIVAGNKIGTDVTGTIRFSNGGIRGIQIASGPVGTIIGGTAPYTRNIISGNKHYGVEVVSATGTKVIGNYIGTDVTGMLALANSSGGLDLYSNASNNQIGTNGDGIDDDKEGNLISGNEGYGLAFYFTSNNNIAGGNLIGTNATGTALIPNRVGMHISNSNQNTIGFAGSIYPNVISGNMLHGILISGTSASNLFHNNYIGIAIDGITSLPNLGEGVSLQGTATANVIGGTGAGEENIIAYNGGAGITSTSTLSNTFRGNSIYANTRLGIDLSNNNVTPDDAGDADTGPNDLQNFPFILSVTGGAGSTTINGILYSLPDATYTLDFYSNTTLDPSGYGEGQTHIGSIPVTTGPDGIISFSQTFAVTVPNTNFITATATDAMGSTSEFSGPYRDALPVRIISFEVVKEKGYVQLIWKVAEEVNVRNYTVESSFDGIHFTSLGEVFAEGDNNETHNYFFSDTRILHGEVYYRIVSNDVDGTKGFTEIKAIELNAEAPFALYPNPSKGKITIESPLVKTGIIIQIRDVTGRLVYEEQAAAQTEDILCFEHHLKPGIYILSVLSGNTNSIKSMMVE